MNDGILREPRWTHVALPSSDLDAAIEFYTTLTPLVVVARHADDAGRNAWLSNDGQADSPFVLVLVEFTAARGHKQPQLTPFAHLGIEVPRREDVDTIARRARDLACLAWEPRQLPPPIGYICALSDPDGNIVEISYGQEVYAKVKAHWSPRPPTTVPDG